MIAPDLLFDLRDRGVSLSLVNDRLRVEGPEEVLTPELLSDLSAHKAELLDMLTGRRCPHVQHATKATEATKAPARIDPGSGTIPASRFRTPPLDPALTLRLAAWPPSFVEDWEERASVREYDGSFDRAEAERLALGDVEAREADRPRRDFGMLECPTCGGIYLDPVAVVINAGGRLATTTAEGTTSSEGKAEGRGVVVRTYFKGECGHRAVLSQQFHKGHTFMDLESPGAPPDDPAWEATETIWRD